MDRLTEYHGEKAVIKDKVLLPQAMQKLAEYEELEEKDCVIRWHPADEPPSDDRYILLSFENAMTTSFGRYEGDETGGAYYIDESEEPCIQHGIVVNAWAEMPMSLKEVAEAVDAKDTNVPSKWIPCSERLPEDESYILVSFENATMLDIARYEENDEGGTFYPGDDEKSYSSYGIFVNVWMPLPEPYKEKTE